LPRRIELDSTANSRDTLQIYCSGEWTLEVLADWIFVNPNSGTQSGKVVIGALTSNTDTAIRKAFEVLSAKKADNDTIEVVQRGSQYYLTLSPTSLTLGPEANNTVTFSVNSNTSWTLSTPQNWLP